MWGGVLATDYSNINNYIPNFANFNTIVFLSSMMFAFAGLEISSMIVARIDNPKENFAKSIFLSTVIIVSIYILLTFCLNIIYPAKDTNILNGLSTAVLLVSKKFNIKYLPTIFELSLFLGVLAQINSWLLGPMQMLSVASAKNPKLHFLSKSHKKYSTPANALIFQAILVCILLTFIMTNKNIERLYYSFISCCSLCYFIPYLIIFPSYLILRKKASCNAYSINGKILPYFIAILGFLSVLFAIILTLIPPDKFKLSGFEILKYEAFIFLIPILTLIIALATSRNLE